jgi:hypothetical protein
VRLLISVLAVPGKECLPAVARRIVSTGLENEHACVVWDWQKEQQIASCNMGPDQIFAAKFSSVDDTIVAVGVKCFKLLTISGRTLTLQKGVFGPKGAMQTLMSLAFTSDVRVAVVVVVVVVVVVRTADAVRRRARR